MRDLAQLLGVALAAVGAALLWSPWALVIAGAVLIVGPEVLELREAVTLRRDRARKAAR